MIKSILKTALLLIVAIFFCSCGESVEPAEPADPTDMVKGAFTAATGWGRYDLSMETYIRLNPSDSDSADDTVTSEMTGRGVVIKEPYKSKFSFSMFLETAGIIPVIIEQYMEKTDDGYTMYQSSDMEWLKYTISEAEVDELGSSDPMDNMPRMIDCMRTVEYIGNELIHDERAADRYSVAFSNDMYDGFLQNGQLLGVEIDEPLPDTLSYDVWLDHETGDLLRYETDFSEVLDKVDRWNAQMGIVVNLYGHDEAVGDFEIPEEARQAREVEF